MFHIGSTPVFTGFVAVLYRSIYQNLIWFWRC